MRPDFVVKQKWENAMKRALLAVTLWAGLAAASAPAAADDGFVVMSPDITPGAPIAAPHVFNGFGCTGDNISPALQWRGAPEGTKSFAITVYDPDAPTGSGWWHWVVFNIPNSANGVARGAGDPEAGLMPDGVVQSRTDYGVPGYGGPCPPEGDDPHRYHFKVHALSVDALPLDADASGAMVGFMINANKVATATVTATYGR
jgi:hypothetical protein